MQPARLSELSAVPFCYGSLPPSVHRVRLWSVHHHVHSFVQTHPTTVVSWREVNVKASVRSKLIYPRGRLVGCKARGRVNGGELPGNARSGPLALSIVEQESTVVLRSNLAWSEFWLVLHTFLLQRFVVPQSVAGAWHWHRMQCSET